MLRKSKYPGIEIEAKLKSIKCFLLDMDGTVSLEEDMIPYADLFFNSLNNQKYIFVTNNSSHSAKHYVERMNRIGILTNRDNVLTSTDALIEFLNKRFDSEKIRVLPLGTPDFEGELLDAGFEIIKKKNENIDAVLLAFDTTLTYEKLDAACDYIRSGVSYFVANPDKVCPLANGKVLPDCGAILAFIKTCTGICPEKIIGKPDSAMIDMIIQKYAFEKDEIAMVGDRIYTDLAFAINAGIMSIAVLTGEATFDDIIESNIHPDFIFDKIADIAHYL